MDRHCTKRIRQYLESTAGMRPEPTGVVPRIDARADIRAVIFDIYGTLLVSASGDIDEAAFSSRHLITALEECAISLTDSSPGTSARVLLDEYRRQIHADHDRKRAEGIPWPEVDIRAIWQRVFISCRKRVSLPAPPGEYDTSFFSILFELLSNPVCAMPWLVEVLHTLHTNRIPLGIVSNAQFYTPLVLEYYLTGNISDSGIISLFDNELCVYSYKLLRAKPDTKVFKECARRLSEQYGIAPAHAVYVGNDMLKDILPASTAGFKTALFAGDARSLRTHTGNPRLAGCTPDYIITRLEQLCEILP